MKLKVDYNNMMRPSVGERGIDESVFANNAAAVKAAHESVMNARGKG